MTMHNKTTGARGEDAAAEYLKAHGYSLLKRNYRAPVGELDIIARLGDTIAFVEVKTRRGLAHGTPAQAVNYYKQQKIIRTANWYIQQTNLAATSYHYSFDVIEVYVTPRGSYDIRHIVGAFEC